MDMRHLHLDISDNLNLRIPPAKDRNVGKRRVEDQCWHMPCCNNLADTSAPQDKFSSLVLFEHQSAGNRAFWHLQEFSERLPDTRHEFCSADYGYHFRDVGN